MHHLVIPVLDEHRTRRVTNEVLEVEPVSSTTFRLLHSPAFVAGLAGGDVIEPNDDSLEGFRLVSRAGNFSVVVTFPTDEQKGTHVGHFVAQVQSLGGVHEGGPPRVAVFTVPVTAGFPQIESLFNGLCSDGGILWWFGNVAAPDGTLLNWWK